MREVLRRQCARPTYRDTEGEILVATGFDLLCANYGLDRGFGGRDVARDYDADAPFTPAWQEKITGIPREKVIAVARAFARNAAETKGRSMVILGAGLNHWYHMDMAYRGIINMLVLCGCVGQSGGGWSHYVGPGKTAGRRPAGCRSLSRSTGRGRPGR